MSDFLTKAKLYGLINAKFDELGYAPTAYSYRINAKELAMASCLNLEIQMISFEETKICGILYKGKTSTTIGLNARRSLFGQNFDCMHELIHYWFHDEQTDFLCTPPSGALGDDLRSHLEWQANEGAAQFLMPYQNFIPKYCEMHDYFYHRNSPKIAQERVLKSLAEHYLVGEMAVEYRINGLSQEIKQYLNGANLDNIKVLARKDPVSSTG